MFDLNFLNRNKNVFFLLSIIFFRECFFLNQAQAALPEKEYLSQLKIANELSTRKKQTSPPPGQALSSTLLTRLFGRYYQVGDHWTVAAWQLERSMMRMTGDTNQTKNQVGRGGVFKYQVTEVKRGTHPEVTIQVTQIEEEGFPRVDPNVQYLQLKMNDSLLQSEKTYSLGPDSHLRAASPNGVHTEISTLELYPLDTPEISLDSQVPLKQPELPTRVQKFAKQEGWRFKAENTLQFRPDDFWGRPIDIIWEQGKPWPSYLNTSGGIAILLNRSTP
jgi:hypothetical protein